MGEQDTHDAAVEIIEHLMSEFGGQIHAQRVAAAVGAAETDLRGQVPPGALPEMLHRLAAYRLSRQLDEHRLEE